MKKILLLSCIFFLLTSILLAQEKLELKIKDGPKPMLYIDGVKYDHAILDLLDQNKIASITILKDEKSLKEYNAPHGVILVTTKDGSKNLIEINDSEIRIRKVDKEPVIIVNGKVSNSDAVSKMSADDIESIDVIKGKAAIEKYDAPNGAVIITMKEKGDQLITIDEERIDIRKSSDKDPVIVIDGKVSDRETLAKLSPDLIKSVNVLKGKAAKEQYNAEHGAVIVITKKN